MTKGDREGWLAWGGIVLFAVVYALVTIWVMGMVRP